MGLRDAIRTWLTPLPATMEEERALAWPGFVPMVDNYLPYASLSGYGGLYPLGGLNQTLLGPVESVGGDFVGLSSGGYMGNGVVFACLNARMGLFQQARPMFRRLRSGTPGELFSTQALEILRTPWPNGTTSDLLMRMTQDGDLAGNAFIVRRGSRLARLRPDWVTIVHGSPADTGAWDVDAEVLGYGYQPGGPGSGQDPVFYQRADVAHFAPIPDPLMPARGMSWLTPLIREIESDTAATTHKLQFFRQGATPSMIITGIVPAANQTIADWTDKFRSKNEGVRNAYKTMFFSAGVDAKVVGADLRQLDFKVVQGAGETRVAAAAGVPPVVVGLSEGLQGSSLNSGNFAASMRRFADLTGRPWWANAFAALSTIVPVPPGAELFYDDRYIPALKDDVKDAAEVQALNAQAVRQYVDAGFDPDAVVDAINAGDLTRLRGKHSGLYSVQLQPPMPSGPPAPVPEPEVEADEEEGE